MPPERGEGTRCQSPGPVRIWFFGQLFAWPSPDLGLPRLNSSATCSVPGGRVSRTKSSLVTGPFRAVRRRWSLAPRSLPLARKDAAPLRREAPGVGEAGATGRPGERPSSSRAEKPGRTNHKPPPNAWVAPKVARGLSSGPLLAVAAARPPRPRPQARGRSVGLRRTYGGDELYDLNFFLVRGKYRWWWQR